MSWQDENCKPSDQLYWLNNPVCLQWPEKKETKRPLPSQDFMKPAVEIVVRLMPWLGLRPSAKSKWGHY
jgi:hypothetical protein